jgi:HEAT repeat protein
VSRARILTGAVLLASSLAAAKAAAAPPPLATLNRTSSFWGDGAAYEVSISAEGTVHYQGRKNVGVIGARTKKLTPAQLAQLIAAFDKAGYFSLRDRYEDGPTDNTWTITSFTRGGRTKKVEHYMVATAPPALSELENQIDAIVGTHEWVHLSPAEARRRKLAEEARARADNDAMRARLPGFRAQLKDPSPDVRRRAALAVLEARGYTDAGGKKPLIGATELAEVAPVIAEALTHASPAVRKEAAQRLIAFGREATALVPALTAALSDPDPYIRAQAAFTLYHIGRPAAVSATPALERALRDADPTVRGEVSRALPALGFSYRRVLDILVEDLRSPDEPVRFAAATVLGWQGSEAVVVLPALRQARGDASPRVREAAQKALASIAP